jgi:hypothetical protein
MHLNQHKKLNLSSGYHIIPRASNGLPVAVWDQSHDQRSIVGRTGHLDCVIRVPSAISHATHLSSFDVALVCLRFLFRELQLGEFESFLETSDAANARPANGTLA